MKTVLTLGLLMIGSLSQAKTVDDLLIHCQGHLKVMEVGKASFSPGEPARGRFPGIPPSGSVDLKVSLQDFTTPGCDLLKSKYGIDTQQTFKAVAGPSYPLDLSAVEAFAVTLEGKVLPFESAQYFGYSTHEKFLPLFPDVVSEDLSLQVSEGEVKFNVPLEFSVHQVYGSTPVEQWSDDKKLQLAEKIAQMKLLPAYFLSDLANLFLNLEFKTPEAQRKHFLLTWKLLKGVAQAGDNQFFEFEVGGVGSQVGSVVANKLTSLANLAATPEEQAQLIFEFPTLLRVSEFRQVDCFNGLTVDGLHQVLKQYQDQYSSLLPSHKYLIQRTLQKFVDLNLAWPNKCLTPLKTAENEQLAKEIIQLETQN
jgi:hypothetical protein